MKGTIWLVLQERSISNRIPEVIIAENGRKEYLEIRKRETFLVLQKKKGTSDHMGFSLNLFENH